MRLRTAVGALVCAFLASSAPAAADVSPSARTLARSLFEQARALMADKKFAEACPKLAESMRLDPAAGTQLNLAYCHEGEGRTATAWAEYNDALTQARRDGRPEREAFISAQLRALSPRLTSLVVTLAPGADVPGLEVSLDGAVVGAAALGVATPVDPGAHALGARGPGFAPWTAEARVTAADGKRIVVIPRLAQKQVEPSVATASSTGAADAPAPTHETLVSRDGVSRDGGRTRGTWGVALLGTGLASAGVGAAFGADAVVKWRDRNAACAHGCTSTGVQAGSAAQTSAWVSDIAIGVGVAAVAAGAYLLLVPASHSIHTGSRARLRAIPIVTGNEIGLGLWGEIQ